MKKNKIIKSIASVILGSFIAFSSAAAQYPSKPISIVVVWPAGGSHDTAARLVSTYLTEAASVPVVVKNVTGAGGSNGMRHIATADKDGYTIGIMGLHAISQSFMNKNAPKLSNIDTVALIGPDPGALQVSKASGIDSIDDYVKRLKDKPGSILNGNDGLGGNSFMFASTLEKNLDIKMTRIPYGGHSPTVLALLSDEVMSTTLPVPQLSEQHKAGKVKTLGVMSESRHHLLPDVPTFKEQGYDIVSGDFFMIVAPKDIPQKTASKLESMIMDVLNNEEFQARARKIGIVVEPEGHGPARSLLDNTAKDIYPFLKESGLIKP